MAKRLKLGERIITALGGVTRTNVASIRKRAFEAGWNDANDDPGDATLGLKAGGMGYKIASGGVREPVITWEQNLQAAWDLKQSNPIVDRVGEIRRDYIVAANVHPQAADPDLQPIVDEFWRINKMARRISEFTRQWSDYGAQCIPVSVRESDGRAKLGYADPDIIKRVIAHPENAMDAWAVVIKPQVSQDPWVKNYDTQIYRIVREAEAVAAPPAQVEEEPLPVRKRPGELPGKDPMLESRVVEAYFTHPVTNEKEDVTGKLVTAKQAPLEPWELEMLKAHSLTEYSGTCFYLSKNADSNQPLGRSDYLQIADTCDQHDSTLFSLGEREGLANLIFADVTITGADASEILEHAARIRNRPPKPGSANVHNESETWDMTAPDLKQTPSIETAKAELTHILGGMGIPNHWYGYGDETNRATAQAQGDPTWKTLQHDQGIAQSWFVEMLLFVRDQAIIAGAYIPEPETDTGVDLPMPEMTVKDVVGITSAMAGLVSALSIALQDRLTTREAAIDAFAKLMQELDISTAVDELKEQIQNDEQGSILSGSGTLFDPKAWQNVHAPLIGDE